jgi:exodeoxyribonuclease-3
MKSISLISWNINGIRSQLKKDFLPWVGRISPDVLCLQETKCQIAQLPA